MPKQSWDVSNKGWIVCASICQVVGEEKVGWLIDRWIDWPIGLKVAKYKYRWEEIDKLKKRKRLLDWVDKLIDVDY